MTLRIDKTISPFYCQTALRLCLEARKMCESGECGKVAKICSYVSTLCSKNGFGTCSKEASLCIKLTDYCQSGRNSAECKKARVICEEAKKMCPQNNMVNGA